ncbi:hypothetical protein ACTQ33_00670 [Candidatus Avoscillospira sp. LCP25S3_F1]|uniref:hypothetical protein n=1 Tax=Candidatus Avoscillospira sp. LCP25S3_F1 TaxID=3438825 RepID=UPI003F8E0B3F
MGIFGSIIGNTIGSVISGAINAATGGSSSSSSSSSSSRPSSGSSSSSGWGVSIGTPRPNDFSGSASGITANNSFQQAIIDQMNSNSAAWWDATTDAERDRLHQQNQQLAELLGGNVTYNNGVWVGQAGQTFEEYPQFQLPQNGQISYQPQDQSQKLEEMYKAQLEAQKAALKEAYENNLSSLEAEQGKLGSNYQSARNDTAAQSALSQQRFNETAAAYGLNSGTAGQAALSYATQLQSNLGTLQAAESAANAEIERQRTLLAKEYENALVEAQADNDYERFKALYEEAVRVDQALQNQSQFNASQSLKQYQTLLDQYYKDREWGLTQDQWQYEQQQDQYKKDLEAAETLMKQGDYSAYGKLMGWDEDKIAQMEAAWQAANTKIDSTVASSASAGTSSGSSARPSSGGSSSGSKGSTGSSASSSGDPVVDAYRAGCRTYSAAVAYFKGLGYGDGISQNMAQDLERRMAKGEVGVNESKVMQLYNNILEMRDTSLNRNDPNFARKAIEEYRKQTSLQLNDDEVAWLLSKFGYTA